jgi:hypothetical protein
MSKEQHHLKYLDHETNLYNPRCPPKLSFITQKMIDPWATSCSKQSKSNEMSVVWQEQESVREFCSITIAQRMVKKRVIEGFLL